MQHEFSRTELLIGNENINRLKSATVAIFGIGGVGSFAVEALARSGVGQFVLVDDDYVCLTNINRQIHATIKTIGKSKVEVMKKRILEINPKAEVAAFQEFYMPGSAEALIRGNYSYIIDAIDTVTGKLDLIESAKKNNIPIISAMGAGNKLDPTKFEVSDIYATSVCPLAKVMRRELKKRNIPSLKVVYSKEIPIKPREKGHASCSTDCICPQETTKKCTARNQIPGSISFVPSVAGLIMAGEVIKDLTIRLQD
ncbi:MAG: tRNA threonylcarbamoyladenosine dehydratase [Eubacteriales bacterium]